MMICVKLARTGINQIRNTKTSRVDANKLDAKRIDLKKILII